MKAKSKSELAEAAGISLDTLRKWCEPYMKELEAMGLAPHAKVLPPNVVKYIAEKFCIDVDD